MEPAVQFIKARNGTESVFIVPEKELIDQTMIGLVEHSDIRILVVHRLERDIAQMLAKKRPIPQHYTIVASTDKMNEIFRQAVENNLIKFQDRWNLMFLDPHQRRFRYLDTHPDVSKIVLDKGFYCQWHPEIRGNNCEWPTNEFDVSGDFFFTAHSSNSNTINPSATPNIPANPFRGPD